MQTGPARPPSGFIKYFRGQGVSEAEPAKSLLVFYYQTLRDRGVECGELADECREPGNHSGDAP